MSGSPTPRVDPSLLLTLHVCYAMHAIGLVMAVITAATVIGSFIFGLPSIVAVIVAYWRRRDARGSWLHTHFEWQIRTFWFSFVLVMAAAIGGVALLFGAAFSGPRVAPIGVIGMLAMLLGFLGVTCWVLYRIAKGWWMLLHGRPAYGGFES